MRNIRLVKLTFAGILATISILSFLLESLFPPLFIPGSRMGISNVFILLAVLVIGNVYGFAVLTVKIIVGSLFSGNISSIMYSLPAGLIALTIQIMLLNFSKRFSIIAVSVIGSVINTVIQNTVFCLVTGMTEFYVYLPYLSLTGILAGVIVGFAVYLIVKYLPTTLLQKLNSQDKISED